ncbi:DHH family phosphoesterase [Harryflintia acetispora]|uniref:Phosphoesterase RecJ-like protein n=1 Tax=Harryflintia acetispora TaxID=1849041 RepID=A0A9X8UIF8_9FIRM|nr:DHH family phosphoesterase [Harryflintia acetispora]TCL42943.1 phosphoesterase RecJ-like protein [Harryflintia acetispora]
MDISVKETARQLERAQDVVIVAHKSPDGDTLGSSFALLYALQALGKRARVECSDPFPKKYEYFLKGYQPEGFEERFVVSVDVADEKLFGPGTGHYAGKADLCIDHHQTNTDYARCRCLDYGKAATAQLMYFIFREMGAAVTPLIADCLFTGITTDTGCFRYTNVTAETHEVAARLIGLGAQAGEINRIMFETKSKSRIAVERMVMESLEYDFSGRCAMICISKDILTRSGASEDELEGVSAMPRQIEGVMAGVTLSEREDGYKVSLRTSEQIDAAEVCALLGGGGHARAAGCFISGDLNSAKAAMRQALAGFLPA